ncbi:hypothetical protein BKI52_26070 [marine bacterium AO1-C]|nr:hypothetical protein BKI52_26070 [marine bacterium AO1-C]
MNKAVKLGMIVLLVAFGTVTIQAQKSTETIKKTMPKAQVLLIDNINGSVMVKGGKGNSIDLTATKTIVGDTQKDVANGKSKVSLVIFRENDTLVAHIKTPNLTYGRNRNNKRGFGYEWDDWNKQKGYDFKFDIQVNVPENTHLIVRTVNRGDIEVTNTKASLKVTNVNGSVYLKNIAGATKARTINGQLEANYTRVPEKNSSYYALNGNIRVKYPGNLSADLRFKSFNGDFYTDYDVKQLPTKVISKTASEGKTKIYKVDEFTSVRVRKGGKVFKFETLNGNIYVNRNK